MNRNTHTQLHTSAHTHEASKIQGARGSQSSFLWIASPVRRASSYKRKKSLRASSLSPSVPLRKRPSDLIPCVWLFARFFLFFIAELASKHDNLARTLQICRLHEAHRLELYSCGKWGRTSFCVHLYVRVLCSVVVLFISILQRHCAKTQWDLVKWIVSFRWRAARCSYRWF